MKPNSNMIYYSSCNIGVYIATVILLMIGAIFETNVTLLIGIFIFIVWDIKFFSQKDTFAGRTIEIALQQIHYIREHISYLIAFYGVLFGILFTQQNERQLEFLRLVRASGVEISLLVIPLVLATITLLFVPIQVASSTDSNHKPSDALKALLSFCSLMQNLSIFIFLHVSLRILSELARLST